MAMPSAVLLTAGDARADTATIMSATLPTARYFTSAVSDGTNAYVFGGHDGSSSYMNQIVRYNPATNTVTTMTATLPTARYGTSAVWDGTNAYIFGGADAFLLNQIVRYNPATDTVTTMTATLPTYRYQTSAVWDGTNAYIFGGWDGSSYSNQIVRYNPATNTVTTMTATLPTGRYDTSAVWDGTNAYVFGGHDGSSHVNQIVRYDPATDTVTTMTATLPPPGGSLTSAVWDGTNAYIFGGGNYVKQIVRYDPATDTVATMAATLPTGRWGTSAAWDGTNAYIFGGYDETGSRLNQIVRYSLEPGAPRNLIATSGPGAGGISLSWQPPPDNTYSNIANYKVYRSNTNGGPYTLIATLGNVLSYVDSGLPNGATRYYRVTAVNTAGESPQSNEASATTFAAPGAPRSLTAAAGPGVGEITLSWQPPAWNGGTAVTGYKVYRGTSSGGETLLVQLGNVLTYKDTGLGNGATLYYQVSALNIVGEGARSAEASATTFVAPSPPQGLAASAGPVVGEITLTWQAPASDGGTPVTGYRVHRGGASGGPYEPIDEVASTTTTYTDADRTAGTEYFYRVTAFNFAGEGPQSNEASAPGTAPPHTAFLEEDFDSGDAPGWSLTGLWHVTDCRSASAPYSLGYNSASCPTDFDVGATSGSAITPPIEVPLALAPAFLTWQSWHDTESGFVWDQKKVLVSADGGATWDILWQEDGPQRAWNARSVDLAAYAGKTVHVRFHFDSRSATANTGEGWYVDDVRIASAAGALT